MRSTGHRAPLLSGSVSAAGRAIECTPEGMEGRAFFSLLLLLATVLKEFLRFGLN